MKDIVGAMEEEQKYLNERLLNKDVELNLEKYGYSDLENYFSDKQDKMLSNEGAEVKLTTMENIDVQTEEAISNRKPSVWIPQSNKVFLWYGGEPINNELINKEEIEVYNMGYIGGTIVSGKEDLSIEIIVPDKGYDFQHFLNKLCALIPNGICDNNDIMQNGKKVVGAMCRSVNGMFVFAFNATFVDRKALITQICLVPHNKEVGYIEGITKEQLLEGVLLWLQ